MVASHRDHGATSPAQRLATLVEPICVPRSRRVVRARSAGCATVEEAYSLAVLPGELLGGRGEGDVS